MNICEAVEKAIDEGKYIFRKSAVFGSLTEYIEISGKHIPLTIVKDIMPEVYYQPTLDDLTADDWVIVDKEVVGK